MGITALWRWLSQHCRTQTPSQRGQVQALFIDFPGIRSTARSRDLPEEEFYSFILRELCRIIELVNPTQLVYIGEDGIFPRAKSQTQWKRDDHVKQQAISRARAQKKKELEEEIEKKKKERKEAREKRKKEAKKQRRRERKQKKREEEARKKKEMKETAAIKEAQEIEKEEEARKKKEEEIENAQIAEEKKETPPQMTIEEEEEEEVEDVEAEKFEEEEEEELTVKPEDLENVQPKAPVSYREETFMQLISSIKTDRKMARTYPQLKRIEVIFDSRTQWKEAEHKVIDFLRFKDQALKLTWAIWSGDSDFVPLTLALRCDNIFIMNANQHERETNDYCLSELRRDLSRLSDGTDEAVDDFICLTALAENDYLPGISNIGSLVAAYQDMYRRTSKHLIHDGRINNDALKELLRSLLKWQEKEDCVCNTERERQMSECYLSGLTWYTNLYFGIGLDWSYCYMFSCPPPIASLIQCLDDGYEVPTSINKKPDDLDTLFVYREVKRRANREQIKMVFNEVFGTSLDDILATTDSLRNDEIMRRVFNNYKAMEKLRAKTNMQIRKGKKMVQCVRYLCPKELPQECNNPWKQVKFREKQSVLPSSESQRLLVFGDGQNVVVYKDRKAHIGVVVGSTSDGRYQVRLQNDDEQVESVDIGSLWSFTELMSNNGPHKKWSFDGCELLFICEELIDKAISEVNRHYERCAQEIEKTQNALLELQSCFTPSRSETELTKVLEKPQSDIIAFLKSESPSKHFHPVVRQEMGTVTSFLSVLIALIRTIEPVTCLIWLEEALLNVDLQDRCVREATIMVLRRLEHLASLWRDQFCDSLTELRHINMIWYTVKSLLAEADKYT